MGRNQVVTLRGLHVLDEVEVMNVGKYSRSLGSEGIEGRRREREMMKVNSGYKKHNNNQK